MAKDIVLGVIKLRTILVTYIKEKASKIVVFISQFRSIETVVIASFVSRKQTNTRHCSHNNGDQLEKSQSIWKLIRTNFCSFSRVSRFYHI